MSGAHKKNEIAGLAVSFFFVFKSNQDSIAVVYLMLNNLSGKT